MLLQRRWMVGGRQELLSGGMRWTGMCDVGRWNAVREGAAGTAPTAVRGALGPLSEAKRAKNGDLEDPPDRNGAVAN